jgi:hypothetical protein
MKTMKILNLKHQRFSLVRTDRERSEDEMTAKTLRELEEDGAEEDEGCPLICLVWLELLLLCLDYIMEVQTLELLLSLVLRDSFRRRQWDTFHLVSRLT